MRNNGESTPTGYFGWQSNLIAGINATGGHYHQNWAIDGFRGIVLNAIVWVAGMDVPKRGVHSKPLTEDELRAFRDDLRERLRRAALPE